MLCRQLVAEPSRVVDLDPMLTTSAAYLYVDDADALFAEWRSSGVSGHSAMQYLLA